MRIVSASQSRLPGGIHHSSIRWLRNEAGSDLKATGSAEQNVGPTLPSKGYPPQASTAPSGAAPGVVRDHGRRPLPAQATDQRKRPTRRPYCGLFPGPPPVTCATGRICPGRSPAR